MAVIAGSKLGTYEVLSPIGAGGMGEVWRARDTRLEREVAIKTLPDEFAKDADRLSRLEREAKLLASLNHPNIAAIHGLEEFDHTRFLVLELIHGETLAERLKRGAIPLEEALTIGSQIASALEAAHEKGVIHRDLKPANIKITPNGTVKVLDFGLAKALENSPSGTAPSDSPTLSMAATNSGMILGTAAYMSPEQAKGKPVDKRADIWAFGVVLYEMLTGRSLFGGEDVGDILAAVIKEEPKWDGVPRKVQKLLKSCLEKDVRKRLRDIGDAWRLLEEPAPAAAPRGGRLSWAVAAFLHLLPLRSVGLHGVQRGPSTSRASVSR
jgi:eukaryotic-like serine/threonine-protein kinase